MFCRSVQSSIVRRWKSEKVIENKRKCLCSDRSAHLGKNFSLTCFYFITGFFSILKVRAIISVSGLAERSAPRSPINLKT